MDQKQKNCRWKNEQNCKKGLAERFNKQETLNNILKSNDNENSWNSVKLMGVSNEYDKKITKEVNERYE